MESIAHRLCDSQRRLPMIRIGRAKTSSSALMAYPGFGSDTGEGNWRIFLSGVAWQEPVVFSLRQRMMIRMLGGVMKASSVELQSRPFQDRITPFMAEADDRQSIIVEIAGRSYRLRKRTSKNGHFRDFLNLADEQVQGHINVDEFGNRTLEYLVAKDTPKGATAGGQIYLLDSNGTSIISDIDDTIKESSVGDRQQLLTNTFLRDFRSIEGMADVYRQWSNQGVSFHYVSSSPWQLFESLQAMHLIDRFPAGTMHLRNFRLRDQLLKKVSLRRHGKATAIRFLLKNLPQRKFVLIGDSGEKDPEIYGKICRKFPGRIKSLLIRELSHRRLESDRIRKIEESLATGLFQKFNDAAQLRELTARIF